MLMPADASPHGGSRKKRTGLSVIVTIRGVVYNDHPVLPCEKLCLEHLPAANRYFKRFVYRDAITFTTTK